LYLYFYPRSAPTVSKWSIRGSLLGILVIVIGSAMAGRLDVEAFGYGNVLLVSLFAVLLAVLGYVVPRLVRLARPDSAAIEFEVIVRNINLGILIKVSIFPAAVTQTAQLGDMVLFTLLLYGALQLLLAGVLIGLYRRA
jgi:BASS family bile acid:Na+ symporter